MSKGISKGISKDSIVNITLELIRNRESIRSVNLREIGRVLGCAHTNIYNHFTQLDAILWEAVDQILIKSSEFINDGLDKVDSTNKKLEQFYTGFIEFYLTNPGWFRLFWIEKLEGDRPEKNIKMTAEVVEGYVFILASLYDKLYSVRLSNGQVMKILHTIHCYIYGEVAIFIAGRGLITNEKEFKKHVLKECLKLGKLYIAADSGKEI